jgi:hypothetical protein
MEGKQNFRVQFLHTDSHNYLILLSIFAIHHRGYGNSSLYLIHFVIFFLRQSVQTRLERLGNLATNVTDVTILPPQLKATFGKYVSHCTRGAHKA